MKARELKVGDKFRRFKVTMIVHKITKNHVFFHATAKPGFTEGHTEFAITKDEIVEKE